MTGDVKRDNAIRGRCVRLRREIVVEIECNTGSVDINASVVYFCSVCMYMRISIFVLHTPSQPVNPPVT